MITLGPTGCKFYYLSFNAECLFTRASICRRGGWSAGGAAEGAAPTRSAEARVINPCVYGRPALNPSISAIDEIIAFAATSQYSRYVSADF